MTIHMCIDAWCMSHPAVPIHCTGRHARAECPELPVFQVCFKGPQCLSSKLDFGIPEASHALCSRDWEDVSHLLADIGLILEYADFLSGRTVPGTSCALLETQLCLPHVVHLACMHLPFVCGKGWASLASKVSLRHELCL